MTRREAFSRIDLSSFFPALAELPTPPLPCAIRGTLEHTEGKKIVAVVGSRAHTSYGARICRELIAGLRGYPVVIVSGLALGIDAIAHKSALDAGLTTIAFPGSGLSDAVLYPRMHRGLAEDILASGGALLSEFDDDFRATPWSFPQRNRLVAGIADIVIVVEAKEKSGALITARLGTEYNRLVGAVPGSVDSDASRGTNWLLRLGATVIRSSEDILEELGLLAPEVARSRELPLVNDQERRVLDLLTEPRTRDYIIEALDLDPASATVVFSSLEIKGFVRETYGMLERIV